LFFAGSSLNPDFKLWKSDGTESGTVMVKDVKVAGNNTRRYQANVNGTLYFAGLDIGGVELWRSDGTASGTVRVKDISPLRGSYPRYPTNVNGTLFFQADDRETGLQLWCSDGTESGTLVADTVGNSPFRPTFMTPVGQQLFLSATDAYHGFELWSGPIADADPGAGSICSPDSAERLMAGLAVHPVLISGFDEREALSVEMGRIDGTDGPARSLSHADHLGILDLPDSDVWQTIGVEGLGVSLVGDEDAGRVTRHARIGNWTGEFHGLESFCAEKTNPQAQRANRSP
jgi:ELWxxDGT repeat protein